MKKKTPTYPPVALYLLEKRQNAIPDGHAPDTISLEIAQSICREFKIPISEFSNLLKLHVNQVAQIYWTNRIPEIRKISARNSKREIEKLQTQIQGLIEALNSLSSRTAHLFWRPETRIDWSSKSYGIKTGYDGPSVQYFQSEFGHTITTVRIDANSIIQFYINRDAHYESLNILSAYAKLAIEGRSTELGGRPTLEALRLNVLSHAYFWSETLGRPFKADYQKGEPVSAAARFATRLARVIDASVSEKQAVTAIRYVIRKNPKLRTIKNPA
jgi:hypothetical protein